MCLAIRFQTQVLCSSSHFVSILGNIPELGDFKNIYKHPLTKSFENPSIWISIHSLNIYSTKNFEYKFVICDENGSIVKWELPPYKNRKFTIDFPHQKKLMIICFFDYPESQLLYTPNLSNND